MPIYEYQCERCGEKVERLQNKSSAVAPAACGACGAQGSMQRIMSQTSFQLKGGGWYVTDYKPGESAGAGEAKESKPAEEAPKAAEPASKATEPAPKPTETPAAPAAKNGTEPA